MREMLDEHGRENGRQRRDEREKVREEKLMACMVERARDCRCIRCGGETLFYSRARREHERVQMDIK
jgi:hypothetical protein